MSFIPGILVLRGKRVFAQESSLYQSLLTQSNEWCYILTISLNPFIVSVPGVDELAFHLNEDVRVGKSV